MGKSLTSETTQSGYLKTDRSIRPQDMLPGDLLVGHHEGDPKFSIPDLDDQGKTSCPVEPPWLVTVVRSADTAEFRQGVYYKHPLVGEKRYCDFVPRNGLWLIVRARPGIPKFIDEFPGVCPRCSGRIYVGLSEVVHERGRCET
jgi:hypothetical protein